MRCPRCYWSSEEDHEALALAELLASMYFNQRCKIFIAFCIGGIVANLIGAIFGR